MKNEYSPREASAFLKEQGIQISYGSLITRCHEGKIASRKVPLLYSTKARILIPAIEIQKIVAFYKGVAHE